MKQGMELLIGALLVALAVAAPALLAGCATTVHQSAPEEAAWRSSRGGSSDPAILPSEPLPVYVARFDLASKVVESWPELGEARVGLGLANRIAEAVYASGRFRLLEEKAEVVARLADFLRGEAAETVAGPEEAPWLLYGEVTAVEQRQRERVAGLAGRGEAETTVRVQVRLVERATRRAWAASGSGTATGEGFSAARLAEGAVAEATEAAVREAVARLVAELGEP